MDIEFKARPPRPFTTDGCSGGMSKLWRLLFRKAPPWEDLCVTHDRAYWKGGTKFERTVADRKLAFGVFDRHGYRWVGALMQLGVWFGGSPLWPFSWRWGYGWPYFRPYDSPDHFWSIFCPLFMVTAGRPHHLDREAGFQISLWPKRMQWDRFESRQFCIPVYAFSICASWNWLPFCRRVWSCGDPDKIHSGRWTGRDCEIIGGGWNAAFHIQAGSWRRSFRPWLGK